MNAASVSPLYIGLMSGTSLDGVDAVLADIPDDYTGGTLTLHGAVHVPFTVELRAQLLALQTASDNEITREAVAANALAQCYAQSVQQLLAQTGVAREQVRAIGVHGQTIRHRPELGFTRQTNNPALLAELTGIDVIADFRSRDIAAGGQGARLRHGPRLTPSDGNAPSCRCYPDRFRHNVYVSDGAERCWASTS